MCRLSSMGQGTKEILQHTLSLKQYKVMMPQFSEQECFFIVFSGVLLLPSFSDFYASLTKPTNKPQAHFHVTLPDPPKKKLWYMT